MPSSTGSTSSTVIGTGTCASRPQTTLASHVIMTNNGSVALDGDRIYFPYDQASIASVPTHGGPQVELTPAFTQFVTALDHHVVYGALCVDPTGGDPRCPPETAIVDFDLASGEAVQLPTPHAEFEVAVAPGFILGAGAHSIVQIDRTTAATQSLDVGDFEAASAARVVGEYAFFAGFMKPLLRMNLASGVFDRPPITADSLATDGKMLLVADDSSFTFFDQEMHTISTIPHASGYVAALAFDEDFIYSASHKSPDTVLLTRRDGSGECTVDVGGDVTDLEVDDEAIYATLTNDSFDLVRVEK